MFIYILLPLIAANILHMVVVKKGIFASLAIPLSRGVFGLNKTWRGIVVVPVLNALLELLLAGRFFGFLRALDIGFLLGMAYVLFELPNSWLKRRLGIAPGGKAVRFRGVFVLLDKSDSCFGVSLVSWFLFDFSPGEVAELFVLSVAVHLFFSWLLVMVRVKRSFSVLWVVFLAGTVSAQGQKVFLVHRKNKAPFPNHYDHSRVIGVRTDTDTILYNKDLVEGFRIDEVGTDSVRLKRPLKYSDTCIRSADRFYRLSSVTGHPEDSNYFYRKECKKEGVRYHLYVRVDQYEYRSYAYKDIRALKYPTYHGSGDGCSGCILIPGINVIWLIYAIKRWEPRNLDMAKWKFVVEEE